MEDVQEASDVLQLIARALEDTGHGDSVLAEEVAACASHPDFLCLDHQAINALWAFFSDAEESHAIGDSDATVTDCLTGAELGRVRAFLAGERAALSRSALSEMLSVATGELAATSA